MKKENLTDGELKSFFGKYSCEECGAGLVAVGMEDGLIVLSCPNCDLHQNVNARREKQ